MTEPAPGLDETIRELPLITAEEWARRRGTPFFKFATRGPQVDVLRTIDGATHNIALHRPDVFAAMIPNAIVIERDGIVITDDGFLINEGINYRGFALHFDLQDFFRGKVDDHTYKVAIKGPQRVIEQECVLFGGNTNFGHMVFQFLLRFAVLARLPQLSSLPLVVYKSTPRRFLEFLELIGYGPDRWIMVDFREETRYEKIWVLSSAVYERVENELHVWRDAIWHLRHMYAPYARPLSQRRPRLYFTREGDRWRRCINETDVRATLADFGVEPIRPEGLSIRDQIALVSNAEVLVMPMGACSMLQLFAPEDCIFIEVTLAVHSGIYQVAPAAILGQPYFRINGKPISFDESRALGLTIAAKADMDRDFLLDCATLRAALQIALGPRAKPA